MFFTNVEDKEKAKLKATIKLLPGRIKDEHDFKMGMILTYETVQRIKKCRQEKILELRDTEEFKKGEIDPAGVLSVGEMYTLYSKEEKEKEAELLTQKKDDYLFYCVEKVFQLTENGEWDELDKNEFIHNAPSFQRNWLYSKILEYNNSLD